MTYPEELERRLQALREESRYRTLKLPEGVAFVDNDYLGLAAHPALHEAGEWALRIGGAGSRGSRLLGGHSRWFEDAETAIADFFGAPAALFFSSGYLANLGAIQVLGELVDAIVSDSLNHASLIDGIRLTGKPKVILPHNRWDKCPRDGRRLLVAESLYSMDGDFADFERLRAAWSAGEHFLLLDEAHAAGVFREDGRGLSAPWRDWDRMAVVVTFGKALGVAGSAVLCSRALRELLINRARPFIYTTAPPPAMPAMCGMALEVLRQEGNWRREELWDRAQTVRAILSEVQPDLAAGSEWERRVPIVPLKVPGEDRALKFCEIMRESGVDFRAIRYPTVPRGSERVRISLSLAVSRENTESMAKEVVRRWKAFSY